MYQILKKLLLVLLCLSLLSSFAFAADGPTPSVVVQWSYDAFGVSNPGSFSIDGANPSGSKKTSGPLSFNSASVSVDNSSSSTTVFELSPVSANFSASTTSKGYSVSSSVSGSVATISVVASSDRESNLCGVSFSGSPVTLVGQSFSASGYSYTSSGGGTTPEFQPPITDMNGLHGYRSALSTATKWTTYNQYIGVQEIVMELTNRDANGTEITGDSTSDFISADALAALGFNSWSWKYENGKIKFSSGSPGGTWLDMVFRYLTYDYFWNERLWSNDVSGSWFDAISNNFAYLNFRVNQILDVLANDEDLAIKDATTPEREWVKGYFSGSGDKADADKYDKLNNTGSAFKDAFAGAPDSSIADGFTAVNDNGYEFWSQGVSDDINGNSVSSSVTRAPAYVPPEQRIVDAYSENWDQIVGGYYD